MRIFFAFPFTDIIDNESGLVLNTPASFIGKFVELLEAEGHSVFSAHIREEWGNKLFTPLEATVADLEEMRNADFVVAFPGSAPISGGVHVELGWASSLKKPMLLVLAENHVYSPLVTGLSSITEASTLLYDKLNLDEIAPKVLDAVRKHEQSIREFA